MTMSYKLRVYLCLIANLACFSCTDKGSAQINLMVSEGVMNNYNFDQIGLQVGDTFPDLQFWCISGNTTSLRKISSDKKETVLISGSYTCDKTRLNLNSMDSLSQIYHDSISFYIINTVEAHPVNMQSPYSLEPEPWLVPDNLEAGIEAPQPATMKDRMDLAGRWKSEQHIEMPLVLDGPENDFWMQAGQGPNMTLVISPEGEILHKQAWFDAGELGSYLAAPR